MCKLRKILLVCLMGLSFLLISCEHIFGCSCIPHDYTGKSIKNYPNWASETLVDDWKPWNSEETEELKKLFIQNEKLNDSDVNYRLFITKQNIVLFFDDENRTACFPLRIWMGDYKCGDVFLNVPQEKYDEFIYTGYAKTNLYKKAEEDKKAYVKITLLDEELKKCHYLLVINGIEIINRVLYAKYDEMFIIEKKELYEMMGITNYKSEYKHNYIFRSWACASLQEDTDYRFKENLYLYFEGMKIIGANTEYHTVTCELYGGTERMPKYMDFKYINKNRVDCIYYNIVDGKKKIFYIDEED